MPLFITWFPFLHCAEQERRVKEDEYLKNLRRLDEEIKLMLDRMQQQFQNLSKAYREELTQLQVEPDLSHKGALNDF